MEPRGPGGGAVGHTVEDGGAFQWNPQGISSALFLKRHRERLIDELEGSMDCILGKLLQRDLLTRDDCEDVAYERGPRKQVRKLLDIIDLRGEELAVSFCSLCLQIKTIPPEQKQMVVQGPSTDYSKAVTRHKQVLLRRNDCMNYYNSRHGEKVYLADYFINLLLVKGHYSLEVKKHELLTFGQQRIHLQKKRAERLEINLEQLFLKLNDRKVPKRILVSGVAGIGKTVFVQKILYDFSTAKTYHNFEFVIHFTFRDLNLVPTPTTLRRIILMKNRHLSTVLTKLFENEEKILIILDGFDEFKHYCQLDMDYYVCDPDEEVDLPQIVGSLLNSELLPEATVLLTSRPTVISHIPVNCVERFVIITGFSITEIECYFQKFYQDKDLGNTLFAFVRENHFLFTLCYIPAFCWIVCSVLKESSALDMGHPESMTDIYTRYLVVLLNHHTHSIFRDSSEYSTTQESILSLGKLAYDGLLQHETLFYQHDLDAFNLSSCDLLHCFLDKTSVQEPEATENVFSFTHFTIQEFFAALYYSLEVNLLEDVMDLQVQNKFCLHSGYLDLFHRFLSGLLANRNQKLLIKHLNLSQSLKVEPYVSWLVEEIIKSSENGAYILNLLHCLFEQQRQSLVQTITPSLLRLNVSDNTFSVMDFAVLKYFLDLVEGDILELDLTATNISSRLIAQLQPYLYRCLRIWLGENALDMEAVKVLCGVLDSPQCKLELLGLGWTNLQNEEFLELYPCLKNNHTLQGLWIEGNDITYAAVETFSEITTFNNTLEHVVMVGNKLRESDIANLRTCPSGSLIVASFSDDRDFWKGWCNWIFQRCEVCSDEKLVTFLSKVCRGVSLSRIQEKDPEWMLEWYGEVAALLRQRIKLCNTDNLKRRMCILEQTFSSQLVHGDLQPCPEQ
ncbi:NACHT, LRR and PYD domains-containing protein 3-like [Ambystoma mexicanum]|uniref:NACHT, LRR and PYD domains-containing protein 3-like n=1 Tax=Ambystoma mexicanum TaxID=8296 RepID=UPI0037E91AF6